MQQQQNGELGGDIVVSGRHERGQHDLGWRGCDARKYLGSRGIDASSISTRVAGRWQGHVDLLERVYRR
jgi:hypothetical protein